MPERQEKLHCDRVVPRKGDVDRNFVGDAFPGRSARSSPARGTWIEMILPVCTNTAAESSPARGTWIEISMRAAARSTRPVVPRKGDVDRNPADEAGTNALTSRPPQGGRG